VIEIVDNFLDQNVFETIKSSIYNNIDFPFYIQKGISGMVGLTENNYYLIHLLYWKNKPNSVHYDLILPILEKISPFAINRIKVNFYPVTPTIEKHPFHFDSHYSHKGCIFYLNTNNGKTIFETGEEIDSIENRMLFFDPTKKHASTTCTDDCIGRFNINFNYW
jgi:hypothetical protein